MSFGNGERVAGNAELTTDDNFFVELANAGVTIFASSGDDGPTPELQSGDNTVQADTPASDPNVTGVGGTTLILDSNNNETSEVVWNSIPSLGTSEGGTSGGGPSQFFTHSSAPLAKRERFRHWDVPGKRRISRYRPIRTTALISTSRQ